MRKQYIFNEKIDIEQKIRTGYVDRHNPCKTIRELARYNHYVRGLGPAQSYTEINNYMSEYCDVYTEVGYYKSVEGCIKDASKGAWKNIDGVVVTKQEMDRILQLHDERKERIAFVMLADAKYDNACKNKRSDVTYLSMRDIYNMARVSMPVIERAAFLGFMFENDMIDMNLNPESSSFRLRFISGDDEDVAMVLREDDFKDLAYTYLNYKHGGYKRCKVCGRWIRVKTNTQYCKDCKPKYEKMSCKTVVCTDCGVKFIVNANSRNKKRCDSCQSKFLLASRKERNKKYYDGKQQ